jgi:hypothetical protein
MAKANLSVIVGVAAAVGLGIFLLANQSKASPSEPGKKDPVKPDPVDPCGPDMVSVGGKCVDPTEPTEPTKPTEPTEPEECEEGYRRGDDGKCYPIPGIDIECDEGFALTMKENGGFACCPRGSIIMRADGKCMSPSDYPSDGPKDPGPQGCANGYRKDANGNCIPVPGTESECGSGYRMTPKQDGGFGCCSESGPFNVILSDGTCV